MKRFPIATAIGWAAAAAFAVLFFTRSERVDDLTRDLVVTSAARDALSEELEQEREWAKSMASPGARAAFLTATSAGDPDAKGWALYDPESRHAILVIENLKLPDDKDLELWAIRESGPASLGLLQVEGGRAVVRFDEIDDPESLGAFAVSLEPKGGSPDPGKGPSGPVVLVGELGI